ncbi:MAG: glycosyltransferase [Candidatus Eisenbacteria bacterium]
MSRIQYQWWGTLLRRAAARLGHRRVWLWLYNPLHIQTRATLQPERIIFDLVDDLEAYATRTHSRSTMRRCVNSALREADLVFATSPLLADRYAAQTREGRMHIIPNGVRGEWIDLETEIPADLRRLRRPWIGFMGAVFCYLDYDLLVATARAFPQGTLVMVGPVEDEAGAARLAAEPNVAMLGRRPQERVPDYVGAFDVCLSPFKAGAVRRAVNPLKIYEYLAAGRPVVSTPLESLTGEPIARWIRFAEGPAAFTRAIHDALASQSHPELIAARREAVRPYAWEALAARVETTLEEAHARWSRA